jgi:predicted nucleic-acid-binding protein
MTGLDTNVLMRYLLQDDPKQTRQASQIIDRQLTEQNPGFVNLATILEVVWVLRSLLKRSPSEIATHLEHLLAADSLEIQNEQQVFEAAFALKRGTGEFEDALIGAHIDIRPKDRAASLFPGDDLRMGAVRGMFRLSQPL